jgi:hypothetical protein
MKTSILKVTLLGTVLAAVALPRSKQGAGYVSPKMYPAP